MISTLTNNPAPNPTQDTVNNEEPTRPQINIRDIINRCIANWYWFLICVIICVAVAQYHLMSTNNVYTRTASILVKDNKSSVNDAIEFSDLNVFKTRTNIENEIVILHSSSLMTEVVSRLGLNNTYTCKEGLRKVELYKCAPIAVEPSDTITASSFSFDIKIDGPKRIVLSDFKRGGEEIDAKSVTVGADNIAITPLGMIRVTPTENFDQYVGESITFAHTSPTAAAAGYVARLSTTKESDEGTIINISITSPSIKKADDILNTLIQVYNERWIQDRNQIARSTSHFIDERLAIIENELGNVESDISSYKSENLLTDVNAVSSMYLAQSESNRQAIVDLSHKKALAQYIRKELTSSNSFDTPLPQSSSLSNAQMTNTIETYNQAVIERQRLIEASSIDNPLVKDLNGTLTILRENILHSLDNFITSLDSQIETFEKENKLATGKLAANPNQAKYLLSVERQQKVKESLYLYLLQKREENELSQAFTAYNTRLVTPPGGSSAPTAPNRSSILIFSFLIGLLIPAGFITADEMLNTRIRGRRDIENMTVPFIGEVPLAGDSRSDKRQIKQDLEVSPYVIKKGGDNIINEAVRVVRSNMEFMFPNHTNQERGIVIAVTSINPGSGKSFISLNLATAFRLKGRKTVVIDLDLRRATLSARHGKPATGASNILSGRESDWHSVIVHGDDEHPDILPAGPIPPNPSELLYSEHLSKLISDLKNEYDLIFIDCPPVEVVADTYIINRFADVTIFVIRAHLLDRDLIPEIERLYSSGKLKNMGIILNGTSTYRRSRRYGYSYSYGYGYNYNYNRKKKKK